MTNVDPAWQKCQPLFYGAFDPPSVLSKASRLAPAQADPAAVTPTPPPVPALPPAAQATPAAQMPAATSAPKNNGQKAAAVDPSASVINSNHGILNGNTHAIVATPAASPKHSYPDWQEAGPDKGDPSGQVIAPAAAIAADPPAQSPSPETDPNLQKATVGNEDPSNKVIPPAPAPFANPPAQNLSPGKDPKSQKAAGGTDEPSSQVEDPAAVIIVNSPVASLPSAANVVVAQGTTLTENGSPASIVGKAAVYSLGSVYVDSTPVAVPIGTPVSPAKAVVAQGQTLTEGGASANVGGKAAVYSAGSIYLDSSTPIAVPKAEDKNVVVAQGRTLTENGPPASIGGNVAVYSAGSVYYDSTPIAIPKASPTNVVIAQGQTLSENGPSAVLDGKTALYKAGSIYYDSTPVAVPTPIQGQQITPPVVAAGVTFSATVQTPRPVITNGITFTPAVKKASPLVAGGITFAPISPPISEDTREPVVAGGITFHPSRVRTQKAVAIETPAPLSVGSNPVLKAPNGGLIVAGSTISQGATTSLLGHVIAANSDNVVVDGITHSLGPATAYPAEAPAASPLKIANHPVLKAANGDLIIAGSTLSQGGTTSLLGHTISVGVDSVVLDGTAHAFGPITAHPLETPAPLEIANRPVIKASDGGLVIAGTTIPQGSQTSLFGHVISVGANNVVDDGKILTFAANNEAASRLSTPSLLYGSSNLIITLTPGAKYSSNGHITTYTGSTPSALTEATTSVIGTMTLPLQASALPGQVFVEASVSATPEPLFVGPSPSAVEYVLNEKTATAAASSDVPIGALIIAGLGRNGSTATNSSLLPSIVLVNGTGASSPRSRVGSFPSSTSETEAKASPSTPIHGMGSRVMKCWLWDSGNRLMVLGYILGTALIML